MAAEPTHFDGPLGLAADRGFRSELAALRAKATLKQLLGQAPDYRWPYTAERVVRNATALHLAIRRLAQSDPARLDDVRDAARVAAQAWEGLAALEERTRRATALMNAAVEYELAGYQANAACLARASVDAVAWSAEPTFDGVAAAFVQRLMLRVVSAAAELDQQPENAASLDDDELLARMAVAVGARGLTAAARFFLSGNPQQLEQGLESLTLAVDGFAGAGDARRANLAVNLKALLPSMRNRSTWATLADVVPGSLRWQRYLRVLARGLGASVLDSRSVSELWPSQLAALHGGLLDPQSNKVVRLPTSAGKTRVAELAMVHTLVTQPRKRCLYVAPYRALVNEVQESFTNLFADLGYAASSMLGSYEEGLLDRATLAEDQVLILTPEKLDLVLRLAPEALDNVELIVLDEGHIVGDSGRGARYELLITRLR
jgi:helicase